MKKKRVYVESTVISYLTAKTVRNVVKYARQLLTREWWEQRYRWALFISPLVIREIRRGDPEAARIRVGCVVGLPLLPETAETERLASHLISVGTVPGNARDDALHIANAAVHGMDFLVTWNQKHISNPARWEAIHGAIRQQGWTPAVLVRPDYFVEEADGS